jgi:hypothetical protein
MGTVYLNLNPSSTPIPYAYEGLFQVQRAMAASPKNGASDSPDQGSGGSYAGALAFATPGMMEEIRNASESPNQPARDPYEEMDSYVGTLLSVYA